MSPRRSPVRAVRRGRKPVLLAAVLASSIAAGACTLSPEASQEPSPKVAPSDADLDLSGVPVQRAGFCDLLDGDDVAQALEGPVRDTAHYGNGDEVEVRPGLVDVSHEFGCVFEGPAGKVARAWVFARPVTAPEARTLVRRARRGGDCAFPESVRFGAPTLTSVCKVAGPPPEEAPTVRARLEGLFGDSWVGCEISEPLVRSEGTSGRADVVQRADQWCTEVVTTIGAQG
jgi:hypothetical protein